MLTSRERKSVGGCCRRMACSGSLRTGTAQRGARRPPPHRSVGVIRTRPRTQQRPVRADLYRDRFAGDLIGQVAKPLIPQGPGRAGTDSRGHLLGGRSIQVDPGPGLDIEDSRERAQAAAHVDTATGVPEHPDPIAVVGPGRPLGRGGPACAGFSVARPESSTMPVVSSLIDREDARLGSGLSLSPRDANHTAMGRLQGRAGQDRG